MKIRGKALFLVAGAGGYVLGARAGRERYDQISSAVSRLWGSPAVQTRVVDLEDKASDVAKQAGSKISEQVSSTASSVAGSVRSKVSGSGTPDNTAPAGTAPVTVTNTGGPPSTSTTPSTTTIPGTGPEPVLESPTARITTD